MENEKLYLKCRVVRRYFGLPLEAPDNNVVVGGEYTTVEEAARAIGRTPTTAVFETVVPAPTDRGLIVQYATEAQDGSVYDWYDTTRISTPMVNADIEARRWCERYYA
jgi:hypothetical protein